MNIREKALALGCLVALASFVSAQASRDETFWRNHLFQGVREDLDRVQRDTPGLNTDQYRLGDTRHDLDWLQGRMNSGRYDQPGLDKAIAAVERVMMDENLSPRGRDMLREDVRRLRWFREHHDGYDGR